MLPVCTRRLLAQGREHRLLFRDPRREILALLTFRIDLEPRRLQALGLLAQPRGKLLPAPPDRLDRLLHAGDLRPRVDHLAIAAVVGVGGVGVRDSRLLELGLEAALGRQRRVQPALLICDVPRVASGFLVAGAPLEREVLGFELALRRLELAIPLGQRCLTLEVGQPTAELLAQVVQAIEVLQRVAYPVLGLAPALLVHGDAGRLLEHVAQVLRPRLDNSGDRSLLDDRVAARAEPRAVEHVHHVPAPAPGAVQPVRGLAFAHDLAAHRDLVVRGKAAAGPTVEVVEDQLHARTAHRLARPRAVEHHVRHGVAAQTARGELAHHPANRIDDVRLAAAVRSDHADDAAGELDGGGVDEGLEAREPNLA